MNTLVNLDSLEEAEFYPVSTGTHGPISWSPKMAFDLAMGDEDPNDVMGRYDLSLAEYQRILSHPAFRMEVNGHMKDVREKGVTFKAKARIQAEEYLRVVDDMITDPEVGNTTKLDAIKSVVKWAELDSAPAAAGGPTAPQFNIQINL